MLEQANSKRPLVRSDLDPTQSAILKSTSILEPRRNCTRKALLFFLDRRERRRVTPHELRLLAIETARVRHAWAKAQIESGGPTPALLKYLVGSASRCPV
jgi:hypothetical protein